MSKAPSALPSPPPPRLFSPHVAHSFSHSFIHSKDFLLRNNIIRVTTVSLSLFCLSICSLLLSLLSLYIYLLSLPLSIFPLYLFSLSFLSLSPFSFSLSPLSSSLSLYIFSFFLSCVLLLCSPDFPSFSCH